MNFRSIAANNWPILAIVAIASILRFWHLESLTTFSGDQGYDFLIVKRMIVNGHFTLLGPKIGPYNESGNLYLGPAYYYLIALPLYLFKLDPVGPAVFTAILSVLAILIIYKICQKFLAESIALVASVLFAFNSLIINQSRASSNPHLIPFFSSIFLYSGLIILFNKTSTIKFIHAAIAGVCSGIIFQLHYISTPIISVLVIYLIVFRKLKYFFIFLGGFLISVFPQILFEIRHQFFVTHLVLKQLSSNNLVSHANFSKNFLNTSSIIVKILFAKAILVESFIVLFVLLGFFIIAAKSSKIHLKIYAYLFLTILAHIVGTSLYPGSLAAHYFAPIYPSLVILLAAVIVQTFNLLKNYLLKVIFFILVIQIVAANLLNLNLESKNGYTMPDGWNMIGVKRASSIIAADASDSKKFNVAATLDGDTRARPYRYLLEVKNKMPLDVEYYPQADIIYLISRDSQDAVKNYKVWEVASFAPFTINKLSDVQNGVKVFKLEKTL